MGHKTNEGKDIAVDYYRHKGEVIRKASAPIGSLVRITERTKPADIDSQYLNGAEVDTMAKTSFFTDIKKVCVLLKQIINGETVYTLAIPTVDDEGKLSKLLITKSSLYDLETIDTEYSMYELSERNQLIAQLHNVGFCATPTVITMDMGLEYDYITSDGAGSCFGTIGEWPAYVLKGIGKERWLQIKQKAKDGTLMPSDIKGTDIEFLANNMRQFHQDYYNDFAETFSDLQNLPDELTKRFYCIFDIRSWDDKPVFYSDEDRMLEEFRDEYCRDIVEWNDMGIEDLQRWLDRYNFDDLKSFSFIEFSDGDDEG